MRSGTAGTPEGQARVVIVPYRFVIRAEPRAGIHGLLERKAVRRASDRATRRRLAKLARLLAATAASLSCAS